MDSKLIVITVEPSGYTVAFTERRISLHLSEAESDELFHELGLAKQERTALEAAADADSGSGASFDVPNDHRDTGDENDALGR